MGNDSGDIRGRKLLPIQRIIRPTRLGAGEKALHPFQTSGTTKYKGSKNAKRVAFGKRVPCCPIEENKLRTRKRKSPNGGWRMKGAV